jgi:hypothetical protein
MNEYENDDEGSDRKIMCDFGMLMNKIWTMMSAHHYGMMGGVMLCL